MNYYNEHDREAAEWLRELIRQGEIPAGEVDTRSICDVRPGDLRGYAQCHFFAGIGGWSYALRLAGWPAGRSVWTGSCPCQPFSSAGKGLGQRDERHLWPVFAALIAECRPECVFGEQVASAIGKGWLDGVQADLEAAGYACGAVVLGAHSLGAPHQRQRLYWGAVRGGGLADRDVSGCERRAPHGGCEARPGPGSASGSGASTVADESSKRFPIGHGAMYGGGWEAESHGSAAGRKSDSGGDADGGLVQSDVGGWAAGESAGAAVGHGGGAESAGSGGAGGRWMGDTDGEQADAAEPGQSMSGQGCVSGAGGMGDTECDGLRGSGRTAADESDESGHWSVFRIVVCRDGKARRIPAEPGFFPLAHGVPGRVGLLRGYGNAIVPEVAARFVEEFDGVMWEFRSGEEESDAAQRVPTR